MRSPAWDGFWVLSTLWLAPIAWWTTRGEQDPHETDLYWVYRSHTIVTKLELKGDEEGVIVAVGGMTGGFTMFIKGGRLYYDYNYLDGVFYTLESPPLEEGPAELKFKFTRTADFAGTGELFVNGEKVDEVAMPQMHISTYSLAETFDVGRDTGTQVSRIYSGPFPFTGDLDRVIVTLE